MLSSGTVLLLVCTAFVIYDRLTFQEMMVCQLIGQRIIHRHTATASGPKPL